MQNTRPLLRNLPGACLRMAAPVALLLGLVALLAAAPAGAEPWSYKCFDCPGSLGHDETAHMVGTSDVESHPLHWSATFVPGEAGAQGNWELTTRTQAPDDGGTSYAMLLLDPPRGGGFAGTGGGGASFLDASRISLAPVTLPSGTQSPSYWITSSAGGSSPFLLLGSAAGSSPLFESGGGSTPRVALLEPGGESPPPGQGPTDAIPEPGAIAVFALGLGLLLLSRGRRLLSRG